MPVEYMGLFGLTWEEKVAGYMKDKLKGTDLFKKITDFWQAGGVNVQIVKNLYNEYAALMAKGNRPVTLVEVTSDTDGVLSDESIKLSESISGKTNVDSRIVQVFLKGLFFLARDGKIDFAKWNPAGFKENTALRKSFASERSILDTTTDITTELKKKTNVLLIILGLGVAGYLLSQINMTRKTF